MAVSLGLLPGIDESVASKEHVSRTISSLLDTIRVLTSELSQSSLPKKVFETGKFHRQAKRLRVLLELPVVIPGAERARLSQRLVELCTNSDTSIAREDIELQSNALELVSELLPDTRYFDCEPQFSWKELWNLLFRTHICASNLPSLVDPDAPTGTGIGQKLTTCAPKLVSRHRTALLRVVSSCRRYFDSNAAQEVIERCMDTVRNTRVVSSFPALELLALFLSAQGPRSSSHDVPLTEYDGMEECPAFTTELVDEMFELWNQALYNRHWNYYWLAVIRCAYLRNHRAAVHIRAKYATFLVTKVLESFELPVNGGTVPAPFVPSAWQVNPNASWQSTHVFRLSAKLIVRLIADEDPLHTESVGTTASVSKMFAAIGTFLHPSNSGRWSDKLGIFMSEFISAIVKRETVSKIKYSSGSASHSFDGSALVSVLIPHIKNALLSTRSPMLCQSAAQCVSTLAATGDYADIIRDHFMGMLEFALDATTLDQSHLAPAAMSLLASLLPHLGASGLLLDYLPSAYLASSLPGLDAGDIAKTFSALRLFHRLILHVPVLQQKVSETIFQEALSDDLLPVVDANINIGAHLRAKQLRKASKSVSEKYAQYCECVDALHAWVPELLKRIIQVLEIQEAVSSDDDSPAGLNGRQGSGSQARLVHQLRFLLRPLFGQLDPVLRRKFAGASLVHQITSRGFGTLMNAARAGLIGVVLQEAARPEPQLVLEPLLSKASQVLLNEKSAPTSIECEWWLRLLTPVVGVAGACVCSEPYRSVILKIVQRFTTVPGFLLASSSQDSGLSEGGPETGPSPPKQQGSLLKASVHFLRNVLRGLVEVYPVLFASTDANRNAWWSPRNFRTTMNTSGPHDSQLTDWHVPSEEELAMASDILSVTTSGPVGVLEALPLFQSKEGEQARSIVDTAKRLEAAIAFTTSAVMGAASVLFDEPDQGPADWWCMPKLVRDTRARFSAHLDLRTRIVRATAALLALSHRDVAQTSGDERVVVDIVRVGRIQEALLLLGEAVTLRRGYTTESFGNNGHNNLAKYAASLLVTRDGGVHKALCRATLAQIRQRGDCAELGGLPLDGGVQFRGIEAPRPLQLFYIDQALRQTFNQGQWLVPISRRHRAIEGGEHGETKCDVFRFLQCVVQLSGAEQNGNVMKRARSLRTSILALFPWYRGHMVAADIERLASPTTKFEEFMAAIVALEQRANIRVVLRHRGLFHNLLSGLLLSKDRLLGQFEPDKRQLAQLGILQLTGRVLERWTLGACDFEPNADGDHDNADLKGDAATGSSDNAVAKCNSHLKTLLLLNPEVCGDLADADTASSPCRATRFLWKEKMLWLVAVTLTSLSTAAASSVGSSESGNTISFDRDVRAVVQNTVLDALRSEVKSVRRVGFGALNVLLAVTTHGDGSTLFATSGDMADAEKFMGSPEFAELISTVLRKQHADNVVHTADGRVGRRSVRQDVSDVAVSWMSAALSDLIGLGSIRAPWTVLSRTFVPGDVQSAHVDVVSLLLKLHPGLAPHFIPLIKSLSNDTLQEELVGAEGVNAALRASAEIALALVATASEAPTGLQRIVEDAISAATMNKLGLWRCFCQRLAADSSDVGLQIADSLYTELLGRLETSLSKSGGGSGVDISASDDAGFSVPLKYLSLVIDMLHERIVRFEFGNESAEQKSVHQAQCQKLRVLLESQLTNPYQACRKSSSTLLVAVDWALNREHAWSLSVKEVTRKLNELVKSVEVTLSTKRARTEESGDAAETSLPASSSDSSTAASNADNSGGSSKDIGADTILDASSIAVKNLENAVEASLSMVFTAFTMFPPADVVALCPDVVASILRARALCGALSRKTSAATLSKLGQVMRLPSCGNGTDETRSKCLSMFKTLSSNDGNSKATRKSTLDLLKVFLPRNLLQLGSSASRSFVTEILVAALQDKKPEVAIAASEALVGLIMAHSAFASGMDESSATASDEAEWMSALVVQLTKLAKTKMKRKPAKPTRKSLRLRLAGVLGLGAIATAFPYTVPAFLPPVLVELSLHLSDPSPVFGSARSALANFIKTHGSDWQQQRDRFTLEDWESINDVLASPDYYA